MNSVRLRPRRKGYGPPRAENTGRAITRVRHPDPFQIESTYYIRIRIRILLLSCKNSKKNLDSYYFVTLFDFLSLKNDVNVASKRNKQKNCVKKLVFSWHLEGQ